MNWRVSLALAAVVALASPIALACRTNPPLVVPSAAESAARSELVFIAHVDRVLPLSSEDEKFSFLTVPVNTPVRVPTASTEFSLVRVLKGMPSAGVTLESATWSCGVVLQEGRNYLIFANMPATTGDEIVPLLGSFVLDGSRFAQEAFTQVLSSLSPPNLVQP